MFQVSSAKQRAVKDDPPTQASMRASSNDKVRRNPSTDQRKVRRLQHKKGGFDAQEASDRDALLPGARMDSRVAVSPHAPEGARQMSKKASRDTEQYVHVGSRRTAADLGFNDWLDQVDEILFTLFGQGADEIGQQGVKFLPLYNSGLSPMGVVDEVKSQLGLSVVASQHTIIPRESSKIERHAIADEFDLRPLHTRVATAFLKKG